MKKVLFFAVLVLLLTFGTSFFQPIFATEMRSDSFWIQFGNLNVTSGEKSSASYNVTDTVGQVAPGAYGEYGSSTWFVGGGFQYIYQIDEFSFTISDVDIDLGSLIIGVHNTATNTLTITTRGAGGYTVYAYEQHPLRLQDGVTTLPDTTCNAGTCNESTAQVWTDQNVSGFGFNMTGNDVPSDFVNSTYFRQFADISNAETMQEVMGSSNIAASRQSTVTYKIGMPGTQDAGVYQTYVVYVAVPGY